MVVERFAVACSALCQGILYYPAVRARGERLDGGLYFQASMVASSSDFTICHQISQSSFVVP